MEKETENYLIGAIKRANTIAISGHVRPDGDAIGSSLAMYEYLKKKGKQVTVIVPNYFPDFLKWMTDADKIIQYDRHRAMAKTYIGAADLIVVLDLNEPSRLEELASPVSYSKAKKIMIDHHLHPQKFCDLTISYPDASSTSDRANIVLTNLLIVWIMLFWHYSVEKVVQTYIKKMIYVPEARKNTFCAFLNSFRHLPICLF